MELCPPYQGCSLISIHWNLHPIQDINWLCSSLYVSSASILPAFYWHCPPTGVWQHVKPVHRVSGLHWTSTEIAVSQAFWVMTSVLAQLLWVNQEQYSIWNFFQTSTYGLLLKRKWRFESVLVVIDCIPRKQIPRLWELHAGGLLGWAMGNTPVRGEACQVGKGFGFQCSCRRGLSHSCGELHRGVFPPLLC